MRYGQSARAPALAKMSQAFRSLVSVAIRQLILDVAKKVWLIGGRLVSTDRRRPSHRGSIAACSSCSLHGAKDSLMPMMVSRTNASMGAASKRVSPTAPATTLAIPTERQGLLRQTQVLQGEGPLPGALGKSKR